VEQDAAPTRHHSNLRWLVAEPLHLDDSLQHPTPTITVETHLNAVATVVDSTAWIDAGSQVQCVSTAYNRGTARVNRVLGAAASKSVELAQPHQQVHFKLMVQPSAAGAPTVLIGQLDSASPVHITSLETARLTRAKVYRAESTYNLVGVNNKPLSVIGVIHLTVLFGAKPHNIEVVIVDGAEDQVLFSQQCLGSLGRTLYESSPQGQELTIVRTAYAQVSGQGCWMPAVVRPYKMNHCLMVPEDLLTEDELVSDWIQDQTRDFQRPQSNKTYLVRSVKRTKSTAGGSWHKARC
jgi:hypothetical protein